MSGHSKWSQIKYKKAITDAKKSKIFSKLARIITLATREKGGNPETNATLRLAIEKAKSMNMPADNVERAIKRGTGGAEGIIMEELLYEAYGPGGVAIILEGITDNKRRTVAEIKHILGQYGGKLAEGSSVLWMFDKKGVIEIGASDMPSIDKPSLEMIAIESGADDLVWREGNILEFYSAPEKMEGSKKNLGKEKIIIDSSSLSWIAKNTLATNDPKTREQLNKLFDALDEQEDINDIYSNLADQIWLF